MSGIVSSSSLTNVLLVGTFAVNYLGLRELSSGALEDASRDLAPESRGSSLYTTKNDFI